MIHKPLDDITGSTTSYSHLFLRTSFECPFEEHAYISSLSFLKISNKNQLISNKNNRVMLIYI